MTFVEMNVDFNKDFIKKERFDMFNLGLNDETSYHLRVLPNCVGRPKSVFRSDGDFKRLPTIFMKLYSKAAEKS